MTKALSILKRSFIDAVVLGGRRFSFSDTLIIETANLCSLRCTCCPNCYDNVEKRARGLMSQATFDGVLDNLNVKVKTCFLHACGEPFLNKSLPYFAWQLSLQEVKIVIYSNGYNIDCDILDELLKLKNVSISFSMDLLSPAHYEQLRTPAKFDIAMDSLHRINQVFSRNKRFFGLNVIVDSLSLNELQTKTVSLFDSFSNLNKLSFSSKWPWPALPGTGDIAGHISAHNNLCARYRELPVILWNGDVSFCSFDYSGELVIGNVLKDKFSDICNNAKARAFRRNLLRGRLKGNPLCKDCLLPKYDSMSASIFRTQFNKMSDSEKTLFFTTIGKYYEI